MKKISLTTLKAITFFLGWALLVGLLPVPDHDNPAVWRFWAELIPFLYIAGISLLFWIVEKRKICIFHISAPLKNAVLGIITGGIWLGASFAILTGIGVLQTENYTRIPLLWLWLLSALINTIMQELLVRGYLYQMIKSNYNTIAAAIVTTALFTLLHGGAFEAGLIPVLNVITMSLFMTVILEYTNSLVAPIIIHFLWNGIGSVILGSVSLADDYPHLITTIFGGNILLSGGSCRMEGSIIVLFLNILFIFLFMHMMRKSQIHCSTCHDRSAHVC